MIVGSERLSSCLGKFSDNSISREQARMGEYQAYGAEYRPRAVDCGRHGSGPGSRMYDGDRVWNP